jgi:hypothetical protein
MFSRFKYIARNVTISLLFYGLVITHILKIVNDTARNMKCRCLSWHTEFTSGYIPSNEITRSFANYSKVPPQFSIMIGQSHVLTNYVYIEI